LPSHLQCGKRLGDRKRHRAANHRRALVRLFVSQDRPKPQRLVALREQASPTVEKAHSGARGSVPGGGRGRARADCATSPPLRRVRRGDVPRQHRQADSQAASEIGLGRREGRDFKGPLQDAGARPTSGRRGGRVAGGGRRGGDEETTVFGAAGRSKWARWMLAQVPGLGGLVASSRSVSSIRAGLELRACGRPQKSSAGAVGRWARTGARQLPRSRSRKAGGSPAEPAPRPGGSRGRAKKIGLELSCDVFVRPRAWANALGGQRPAPIRGSDWRIGGRRARRTVHASPLL